MAKKLNVDTRVRFASPKFSEVKGIYENEFKKGVVTEIFLNEYEVYCEDENSYYIVPKKACTKDYYYYTTSKKNNDNELCIC
ncbi:MAG: hypothetical protein ACRCX2_09965 [Paraclostridium sp.]